MLISNFQAAGDVDTFTANSRHVRDGQLAAALMTLYGRQMRTRAALGMTVVVLLGAAMPADAAPTKLRDCNTRADFNLLISSARNMFCRTARRDLRRHRAPDQRSASARRGTSLHARVRERPRRPVAVREEAQGLSLRVQRLMARRRKRSRFEFGGELEGLLERPDPQTEKAQAEDEKTQDGHAGAEHAGAGGPHERLLELQKTAGNRAVGAVLDRLAHDAAHAAPAGGGGWPKEKQILFDGTGMPLESVNLGVVGAAHPGGGSRTLKPDEFGGPGEISVVLPDGGWLNDLERAFRRGEPYKTVEIVDPDRRTAGACGCILTAVAIAGFASSGGGAHPLATVTLKYAQRTLSQKPPA